MAEIELVENWAYYSLIGDLIRQAQNSINIATFDFLLQFQKEKSPTFQIVEKLAAARERGVRIKILLNASPHYYHLTEIHSLLHITLQEKGIDCKLWRANETLHAKMIIVDRTEVVIGSHNISDSALTKNIEISVRITNPQFGEKCSQVFDRLWCYDLTMQEKKAIQGVE